MYGPTLTLWNPECVEICDVYDEDFTIHPEENVTNSAVHCCSSSDSYFDNDEPRRFRVLIKNPQIGDCEGDQEDEMQRLRDAVRCLIQPPTAGVSVRRQTKQTTVGVAVINEDSQRLIQTDKTAVNYSNTPPSTLTSSCDAGSVSQSFPSQALFSPLLESAFEPDRFTGYPAYNLNSSPSLFFSSSPENVEASDLDSPFHPLSGPSPDSRPWTPQDDSSPCDSLLVPTSCSDSPVDLTTVMTSETLTFESREALEENNNSP
ncbi:F-BAR domain only protein 1-like [Pelobates fuscus]|uniref:F-BAR domain only protein 1-like n=1 Tax=Pelobates fuscus TaxID=191477 RepID=UPI002FE4F022